MGTDSHKFTRQSNIALLPAITMLASKLLRQTWKLLLVTLCGMIACVGLVCAIPLFAQVTIQTGIQQVLSQQLGGKEILYEVNSDHPTASMIQQIGQVANPIFQRDLSTYLSGAEQFSLKTPMLQTMGTQTGKAPSAQYVSVVGYNPTDIAQKVTVLQGRLPQPTTTNNTLEIVLTGPVANQLGLHVGDVQQVSYPIGAGSTILSLHVVGIVALRSTAGNIWHITGLSPANQDGIEDDNNTNDVLASLPALLPQVAQIKEAPQTASSPAPYALAALHQTAEIGSATTLVHTTTAPVIGHPVQFNTSHASASGSPIQKVPGLIQSGPDPTFMLYWSYPINVARIDGTNQGIVQAYQKVSSQVPMAVGQAPHLLYQELQSPMMDQLSNYQHELTYTLIAIVFLLISILGLALFMVSLLANILIENQLSTIVILRSRGAIQRHIFGAFALQGLILGLIALVAGPACAILLVSLVGQLLMPSATQSIFAAMISDLPHMIGQLWIIALLTVVVALFIMIRSLWRASQIDIVTLRQNSSRSNQVPAWKRMYLDFILAIIIVAGIAYNQFLYRAEPGFDTAILLAPLSFLAVPLTLLTVSLLFLRFFPLMTHLGTRLITKSKSTPGVLAFAQMERQPHATLRMILLLSLALAAAIYLSTFIATEHNRIQDISNYQVGADFSGQITATNTQQSLQTLQAHYASMPGVTSATLGYNETIQGNQNIQTTIVNAVNANTYAQSAIWSSAYTTQSLQSLMKELSAHRSSAIAKNEVYAIADPQTWQMLGLAPGAVFTLATDDPHFQNIHFIAMTEANYLPGLQDSDIGNTNPTMLIDYQNYAAVYAQDNHGAQLQPNYLWLSTRNDAHSLSQVRQEFPTLQDRRALIEQATNEPLQTAITGTLILGLIISFFLILIGVGLTAWTSVKQRRTSFSILRALGMTPGQITRILLWEQSFTYLAALAIGLFIGWISTFFIVSAYALVDHLLQAVSVVFDNIGLPLQKSAAIPITWFSLMLAIFVLICGATLLLVSYYGTRPALGQALRINED